MTITNLKIPPLAKVLLAWCCIANAVSAAHFGKFTYTDNGSSITITDYPQTAIGPVDIPASIAGKPVGSIGNSAFESCTGLTSENLQNWSSANVTLSAPDANLSRSATVDTTGPSRFMRIVVDH